MCKNGNSFQPNENEFDYSMYYWEENRLKTFTNWPFSNEHRCNPGKMAEAGFYACVTHGETDLAKCFFCNKELDGWESDDDPWMEHFKHSKKCIFLKYQRPERELTVGEHIELIKICFENFLENKFEKIGKKLKITFDETLAPLKSTKKK